MSSSGSRVARSAVFAAGLLLATGAAAQSQFDGVAVERMRLASDRSGIASVEGGRVQEHLDWEGGLWFGWANNPLVAYRLSDGARVATLVGNRFSGSAVASVGLFGGAQLGVELPFVLSQQRYGGGEIGSLPALSSAAVGNVRLVPKLQLLYQRVDGIDLAVLSGFTVPLGSTSSFVGSSDVAVAPEVALSRSFGDLRVAAAVGATFRRAHSLANVAVGSEIGAQAGVAYSLKRRVKVPLELGAALAAATSASRPLARERETPAELRAIASYDVTRGAQLFAGGGLGLTSGWGTPGWRALVGFRMALARPAAASRSDPAPIVAAPPAPPPVPAAIADTDGDGVLDPDDACVREPGPVENRGCPDRDRDGDRVVDRLDECPDVPGDLEHRGCPKSGVVKLAGERIEIQETVYFATDKDVIQKRSFVLLDSVAAVIVAHPEIRIRVEGHTDDRGGRAHNAKLSQRRAASVAKYLGGRGVTAGRLAPVGFGSAHPIASNQDAVGRALNRRVEFHVVRDAPAETSARAAADK